MYRYGLLSFKKNLLMLTEINENVPSNVISDPKRYKQVLFNLVGNALKFTINGTIKISAIL
jgi:two-component system sensor histidine kinase BarA